MTAIGDPRFVPTAHRTPGPEWVDATTLLGDRGAASVDTLITAHRDAHRAPTDAIAGSLLVLEYARLLSWPVLAAHLRHTTRLDPAPDNVAVRPEVLAPGRLAFRTGAVPVPRQDDAAFRRLVDALVDGHLAGLVESVHDRTRAGRRTLWSNVAAALGGGLLALSWSGTTRHDHVHRARRVLDGHPRLRRLAVPRTVRHEGADWMVCWRRGCCLAFRCDDGTHGFCGTCPVLDEPERLRRFRRAATRYARITAAPTLDPSSVHPASTPAHPPRPPEDR